jgi:predicted MFS family arabinose efflux permease
MLPLIAGLLLASIASGRIISKTGKYRLFPIIGFMVTGFGLWLMSHLTLVTSEWLLGIWMFITGLGIGATMQVMVLAVQNATDPKHLGTATSAVTFFRSIGASLGVAIFGAVLTNRISAHLTDLLPGAPSLSGGASSMTGSAAQIHALPPPVADAVLQAFVLSFQDIFLYVIPVIAVAFVVALFLKDIPLRSTARHEAEGMGMEV